METKPSLQYFSTFGLLVLSSPPNLLHQDITEAGDKVQRKFEDEHDKSSRSAADLRGAIVAAMEAKQKQLNTPFTKFLSIANPHNGANFLIEVRMIYPKVYLFEYVCERESQNLSSADVNLHLPPPSLVPSNIRGQGSAPNGNQGPILIFSFSLNELCGEGLYCRTLVSYPSVHSAL